MGGGWGGRVDEIRAGLEAAHGACGAVVGTCGLLGGVEGAQPSSFFGLWVSNLGGVTAPGPAPDSAVSHCAGGVVVSEGSLDAGGGGGGGGCGGGGVVVALHLVVEEGVVVVVGVR